LCAPAAQCSSLTVPSFGKPPFNPSSQRWRLRRSARHRAASSPGPAHPCASSPWPAHSLASSPRAARQHHRPGPAASAPRTPPARGIIIRGCRSTSPPRAASPAHLAAPARPAATPRSPALPAQKSLWHRSHAACRCLEKLDSVSSVEIFCLPFNLLEKLDWNVEAQGRPSHRCELQVPLYLRTQRCSGVTADGKPVMCKSPSWKRCWSLECEGLGPGKKASSEWCALGTGGACPYPSARSI
ncbi:uncharacterized protein LOC134057118, partial [Cinclus cinclus]|uniref:uncharacterized protein LOC134057118 n=1 Tax=Cinclus cinclus TaxID=127875 RepID=UPI002E159D7E